VVDRWSEIAVISVFKAQGSKGAKAPKFANHFECDLTQDVKIELKDLGR
jgi:hypothetical protein